MITCLSLGLRELSASDTANSHSFDIDKGFTFSLGTRFVGVACLICQLQLSEFCASDST